VVRDRAVPLREGVERLLDEALGAGLRLAIASTTTAVNVDALLQSTLGSRGLNLFSVIACGDQVRAKKPAPDIYRLALHHLGLPPERCAAFEDSANGLRAAVGAGLWTVVTPTFWTEGSDFSAAALVLPSFGEPHAPLAGEPGNRLHDAAWLTVAEVERRATPARLASAVHQLYAAAP
jgi:beta-phosphoglucomutase-like phosphatase (HAD superfamily)